MKASSARNGLEKLVVRDWNVKPTEAMRKLAAMSVTVRLILSPPPLSRLMNASPKTRLALVARDRAAKLDRLAGKYSLRNAKIVNGGMVCRVDGSELTQLLGEAVISVAYLERATGLRRKRTRTAELRWHFVRARFALYIECQRRGQQTYDDRLILVKAATEAAAVAQVKRQFRRPETPSMNNRGELMQWRFESILEAGESLFRELRPNGTEVYSSLHERRMTKEREWHPRECGHEMSRTA